MELYEVLLGIKQEKLEIEDLVNSEFESHREAGHGAMVRGLVDVNGNITELGHKALLDKQREYLCELADREWRNIRTAHNNTFMRCGPGREWEAHKEANRKRGDYKKLEILQDYILEHGTAAQKMGVN